MIGLFCLTISAFAGLTACNNDEKNGKGQSSSYAQGETALYTVKYYCEKLDGSWDCIEDEIAGEVGSNVTAAVLNTVGYRLDTENPDNTLSGVVTADGELVLKAYYALQKNGITLTPTANAEISYSVNGEAKASVCYGETVILHTAVDAGYKIGAYTVTTASGKEIPVRADGSFLMPEESVSVAVSVVEDDATLYTVQHYCEKLDGNGFELYKMVRAAGKTNATVQAEPLSDSGLTEDTTQAERIAQGTVASDGSLVLKLYYTRNTFSVSVDSDSLAVQFNKQQNKYGETVELTVTDSVKTGYHVEVYVDGEKLPVTDAAVYSFTQSGKNVTVKAVEAPNDDTPYLMQYYFEGLDGEYLLYRSETHYGTTDSAVEAIEIEKIGYTLVAEDEEVRLGTVSAENMLELKLYYARNEYTVTFVDGNGTTVQESTEKYGATMPKAPKMQAKDYSYWKAENGPYNESATVTQNVTATKTAYNAVISNKTEFYAAFGATETEEGSGKYVSQTVSNGAYLLIADIDFGGDIVDLQGLGGLLEGNGYALKNITLQATNVKQQVSTALFETMSGTIRNVSFENVVFRPWTYFIMDAACGITNRSGIIACTLSGTLENVYIQGTMLGITQSYIIWPGASYKDYFPANDADGIPVAGYVAYDATGATLKNVIVDVESEYRNGGTTTVSLIAGKGTFIADNVFVIAEKNESLTARTAVRNLTPDQANVQFDTLSNLLPAITEAYDETGYCDVYYLEEKLSSNIGVLNRGCVILSETEFTISFEGETETVSVTYGEKIGALPELIADEYIDAYWTVDGRRIDSETIWRYTENKTAVAVYKDLLNFNFEEEVEYEITGNTGSVFKNKVGSGAYIPKNESTACVVEWYIGHPVNGANSLRLGINQGNINLKIKISETAKQVLGEGGSLMLYAKAFNATNNGGVMKVLGTEIPSEYNKWTEDWVKIVVRNVTVTDGYIMIDIQATQMAMYVCIDDIKIIPVGAATEYKLKFGTISEAWVTQGTAIGKLPAIETDEYTVGYWTIDGEKITEDTIYNYGADKTAAIVYQNLLITDFENETDYTTGGEAFKVVVGNGSFTPSAESTTCTVNSSVTHPVNGANSLRLGLNASTTLRIKLSGVAVDVLTNGGTVTLSAKAMLAANNGGTLTVGGTSVPAAYNAWGGEWTKIKLTNLTTDSDGYVSIAINVTQNSTYVCIDDIIVMPQFTESDLTMSFDNAVELVVDNKVWSNATIVSDGAGFDTNSNTYKGSSSSSPNGYKAAQAYDENGKALLVAAGAGPMTIKIKLTTEMLLAIKTGGSMSLQAKAMVCNKGNDGYTPHINSNGTWTSMEANIGDWSEAWQTHVWTSAQVSELLTADGYLQLKFHPQQANLIYFLIDDIKITPAA